MNTKKQINRTSVKFYIYFLIAASFLGTSCQKQKTDRLEGYWHLQHVTQCDTVPKTFLPGDNPGNYFAFFEDNTLSVTYVEGNNRTESFQGKWILESRNKNLTMNFLLIGKRYNRMYNVKKLTKKEIRLEYSDVNGDLWKFIFYKL